ncbi:MAG: type I restriction enzyme HsdR N-terminal domain-containing protein [Methanobrevibacter sp.]|jgi:hypothetical protein|nr:type I restriction enzyme HsdR N-terminal domain-containing protein [Candidatus Methanovirga meridionalis]
MEELKNFITNIKHENENYYSFSEENTKQKFITPLINYLKWNIFDPKDVSMENQVGNLKVDYSLKHNNVNKVFIEAKRVSEKLEKHQEQLLNYSFRAGVKIAILTNGLKWWFYLPLSEEPWEKRRFLIINIKEDKTEDIVKNFITFLGKNNVINGFAIKNAEKHYETNKIQNLIDDNISEVISELLSNPTHEFLKILLPLIEKKIGIKTEYELIKNSLNQIKNKNKGFEESELSQKKISEKDTNLRPENKYFILKGEDYPISTYKELLPKVLSTLSKKEPEFDKKSSKSILVDLYRKPQKT